jgi:uncharacterized protein (DUF1015 family)
VADFRPLAALRYNLDRAGDASSLIAPPYDVVTGEEAAAVRNRSLYNVARVDYGETLPGDSEAENCYTRAHRRLQDWAAAGILLRDGPRFYLYDQEFAVGGRQYRRRAIFGRLRLEEWEKGIVLPHEHTRAAAKEDRLRLLRATRVSMSPIMALCRNTTGRPLAEFKDAGPVLLSARLSGERHVLRPLSDQAGARIQDAVAGERLYVADGHHRYETALFYRNERRDAAGAAWTGEEPENFVLAAVIEVDDPGLVVLPSHRLVRMPPGDRSADLAARLQGLFEVRDAGDAARAEDIAGLLAEMRAAARAGPAFGSIGLRPGRLHLITARDPSAVAALVPAGHAEVWRRLDVNVLHHALFPALGNLSRPEEMEFTEDAGEAAQAVASGEWDLALLLNPTPVDQVLACADAGERMPQKSTYFYPKLATGVLMYPFD